MLPGYNSKMSHSILDQSFSTLNTISNKSTDFVGGRECIKAILKGFIAQ